FATSGCQGADLGKMRVGVGSRDQDRIVEPEVGETPEAQGGGLAVAAQVKWSGVIQDRGGLVEVDGDVGHDGPRPAGGTIPLYAVGQGREAGLRRRRDPAVEVLCRSRN